MSASVTPQFLLEGAAYAPQQCGRLLHDANLLYRSESYATAVAVAAFVREELGRWKILLALRSEVIVGKIITIQSVKTSTKNRVRKQKYGQRYITGEDPILKDLDKELFRALEQWPDHPTLRHPGWSHLPAE